MIGRPDIETEIYSKFVADAFLHYEELGAEQAYLNNILRAKEDWGINQQDQAKIAMEVNSIAKLRQGVLDIALNCKRAFNDVNTSLERRRELCANRSNTFAAYDRKFTGLSPKPYYMRYFVTNELIPGEEVINFSIKGGTVKNVQVVKGLNIQAGTYTPVNAVQVHKASDGSREAGTSVLMSEIKDSELPIGLRLEMDSGRIYLESFVFTRAPAIGTLSTSIPNGPGAKSLGTPASKDDFKRAYEAGELLPPTWKE